VKSKGKKEDATVIECKKATLFEREVIKKAKKFYSLAEASIIVQQQVRQS
jgi:hypothetical protein